MSEVSKQNERLKHELLIAQQGLDQILFELKTHAIKEAKITDRKVTAEKRIKDIKELIKELEGRR